PRGATRLAAPIRRPGRPPRPASLRPVGIRPGTDSDKPYPGIYSKPGHIPGAPVAREIEELQAELRRFAEERDWGHFLSPRSLAASLSIEAAEVLEHFQWLTDEQSRRLNDARRQAVAHEIADVFLHLLQLFDRLRIDPPQAGRDKLALNEQRCP